MGRSVNFLDNAITVIYFTADWMEEDYDYTDFVDNLQGNIIHKLKSYTESERWGNRETKIILENNLCIIGISEYCGLYSLSVASEYSEYSGDRYINNFGDHHAAQIKNTLIKILDNLGCVVLNKIATASNGNSLYEKMKTV